MNKAWKRDGENDEQETPAWLRKSLRPKHTMRGHHLGNPKTPKSRRTVTVSEETAAVLERLIEGRAPDDFVFTTPTGLPLHSADFYERVWYPLMAQASCWQLVARGYGLSCFGQPPYGTVRISRM